MESEAPRRSLFQLAQAHYLRSLERPAAPGLTLAIVAGSLPELHDRLAEATVRLKEAGPLSLKDPRGIYYFDEPLGRSRTRAERRKLQMVFQDPYGSLHPRHTIDRILGEPCRIQGLDRPARRIEAEAFRLAFPKARMVLVPGADRALGALLAVNEDDLVVGATRGARGCAGPSAPSLQRRAARPGSPRAARSGSGSPAAPPDRRPSR